MVGTAYIDVLRIICERLIDKEISWVVYGSTALALRGLNFPAHDIDLLTDKAGAFAINDALKEFEVVPVHLDGCSERFESYIGEFTINGITVEPVGSFHRKLGLRIVSLSDVVLEPEYITLDGLQIPVISLLNQLETYMLCNREKDQVKIHAIKEILKSDR